jgi:hypothetical protein
VLKSKVAKELGGIYNTVLDDCDVTVAAGYRKKCDFFYQTDFPSLVQWMKAGVQWLQA